jgi:HK97 family phage major capsid protein
MNRAYSVLQIKSVDQQRRVFTGIASTPTPDLVGDIIEPLGITYTNPIPLLFHHDQYSPVGSVVFDPPTPAGVTFTGTIPVVTEPGAVKDRVDEAWHSISADPPLIRGTSIGWQALAKAIPVTPTTRRYPKTLVHELSLVTVPMNSEATILAIKSLDHSYLAASGLHSPGVTGLPVVTALKDAPTMQTTTEQITVFSNTRAAKAARMTELMAKAAETGVTLDDAQTEEYDTLQLEVKSVDAHLVRLRALEQTNLTTATPVTSVTSVKAGGDVRGGTPVIQVKTLLPKGTAFTRYAMALAATKGAKMEAAEYARRWHDSTPEVELMLKAAVAAGTTTDATWAAPLVPTIQSITSEFLELLRPATILGKIPGMRQVPFNVKVAAQTGGGSYGWVGEGLAKPVTKLAFGAVTLGMAKCAGIIVLTEELVRLSSPSAEAAVQADMIAGIAAFLDVQFTDPAVAAVANVNPASITNGTVAIASSGPTGDNARADIKALIATFVAANLSLASAVLLMSEANAFALGTALNPLGQQFFPQLGTNGGTIMGIPVVTSSALGTNIILVDARGILYADDGGVTLDVSREASLQMDTAPVTPSVDATVLVNLWQNNLVGLRAERYINWVRARIQSVKYVSGATYV